MPAELGPGQDLDQYRIDAVIARSGMATIFAARDHDSGEKVVLKIPHMQFESDIVFRERFHREEEIGQRLRHPAVVRVLHPREKSRVYMAMEFVPGERLRDLLGRQGRLPIPVAVKLAMQIAEVLEYLHENGVVHRDLKPENVMLMPDGSIKLMDFGIAYDLTLRKMTWSGLSQTVGTPDYMPPEMAKGKRGEPRSDIYSLGVMLYEMLTGELPFKAENVYAAIRAKLEDEPRPPRELRPEIPLGLEEVVLRAMAREPHDRYESALELREVLAHPQSVMITGLAARPREKSRLSPRLRKWVTLLGGIAVYALLFLAVRQLARWSASLAPPHHP